MLLMDTQHVLWLAENLPGRISKRALAAMESERKQGEGLAIAAITLWEIALLSTKGKILLYPPVEVFLDRVERTYTVIPLDSRIAVKGANLSKGFPKDPADRQIAATAIIHGMHLVTSDEKIIKSKDVPCIW